MGYVVGASHFVIAASTADSDDRWRAKTLVL
jgi:hypothetical protein